MKISDTFVKESRLYEKAGANKVKCNICNRRCVIPPGRLGFCKAMKNIDGRLYSLEYGLASTISVNPVEKKPLFHFWPGSSLLTMGSWSCNFTCPWCQNYEISKVNPLENIDESEIYSPKQFVELAIKKDCRGTSMSFSEPTTFFDFSIDVFRYAKKEDLFSTVITNGYFTSEALDMYLEAGADAFNIDIKGDEEVVRRYCGADEEFVWQNVMDAKKKGSWVELTTLIIPGLNDDEGCLRGIADRIYDEVGPETPWHVSRYFPYYKFSKPPTPLETLEKAYKIGREAGLKYIYIGNAPGHSSESTFCPSCGELLIGRRGYSIYRYNISEDKTCPKCGEKIPIVGKLTL
jgi:pyruvate formate lyase activating enzyme